MASEDRLWNLNIRYHRVVLDAIPSGARTALDVGCGDGLLTFDIAGQGLLVTGLDTDAASVRRAASDSRASDTTRFVVGDLFSFLSEDGSFDLVASIAMLHHVDAEAGVRRMRELVRPGGVLAIVGFARPSGFGDRTRAIAGMALKRSAQLRGRYWEHGAPVAWPPPLSRGRWPICSIESFPAQGFETCCRIATRQSGRGLSADG